MDQKRKGGRPKGIPKSGGRKKGTPNMRTVERQERMRMAAEAMQLRPQGQKLSVLNEPLLAKDGLDRLLRLHLELASRYQRGSPTYDEDKFRFHVTEARICAKDLAPYQSPRLAAMVVGKVETPINEMTEEELRASIMEDIVALGLLPAPVVEGCPDVSTRGPATVSLQPPTLNSDRRSPPTSA
jgi:hypothetical protein